MRGSTVFQKINLHMFLWTIQSALMVHNVVHCSSSVVYHIRRIYSSLKTMASEPLNKALIVRYMHGTNRLWIFLLQLVPIVVSPGCFLMQSNFHTENLAHQDDSNVICIRTIFCHI